jgi:hypothetical protein
MGGMKPADRNKASEDSVMIRQLLLLGFVSLSMAACAHPLESVAEQRHQERIEASNANQPLTNGAGDGLGKSFAASQANLSLRTAMQNP